MRRIGFKRSASPEWFRKFTQGEGNKLQREEAVALCERARQGDIAARDKVALSVLPLMIGNGLRTASSYWWVRDDDVVSDMTDMALALYKTYNGSTELTTYAAAVARRHAQRMGATEFARGARGGPFNPARFWERQRDSREARDDATALLDPLYASDESAVSLPRPPERHVDYLALARLDAALDRLPPKERDVIERRYGLNGRCGEVMTLREIGDDLGVSRERTRQIQRKAESRLRRILTAEGVS